MSTVPATFTLTKEQLTAVVAEANKQLHAEPRLITERNVAGERRRLRLIPMAKELGISDRKFREFLSMGIPFTQINGILWFEPAEVHAWLDQYRRKGRNPGIKRTRGIKLPKKAE